MKDRLGCKVRSIELNLPQRCSAHLLSATDIKESVEIGSSAVKFAVDGETGIMVTVERMEKEEYEVSIGFADISKIANAVRGVPDEFINESGDGITEDGLKYLLPLVMGEVDIEYDCGLPKHLVI